MPASGNTDASVTRMEARVSGQGIYLGSRTYQGAALPAGNKFINGYFRR